MSKRTIAVVVVVSVGMICGGISCVAGSKWITPAAIDPGAVKYAERGHAAEPNEYKGWKSLAKAESLAGAVNASHEKIQLTLRQQIDADDLEYAVHKGVVTRAVGKAQALESMFFSEDGLLTMGLSALGFGGLAGLLGLMRKRPGDWEASEVEEALDKAGFEGEIKGDQIVEIVKGIEKLKQCLPAGVWDQYKGGVAEALSSDTKEAIAQIKATL